MPEPLRSVRPYSLLSNLNLLYLQELAIRLDRAGVKGDIVECGVYRGGSAGVLAYAAGRSPESRRLWLFDSFRGMPKASKHDDTYSHSITGAFVGSIGDTRCLVERNGLAPDRYEVVVGWFQDTFATANVEVVALLHVDCDFYDPVRLSLETFYPRLSEGGFVVLNDYGSFSGCRKATDGFLQQHFDDTTRPNLVQIDGDAYYFCKPGASHQASGRSGESQVTTDLQTE
jgi:O-methyltransferase